jgi:hypothetical protein
MYVCLQKKKNIDSPIFLSAQIKVKKEGMGIKLNYFAFESLPSVALLPTRA